MALSRSVLRIVFVNRCYFRTVHVRYKSITGYQSADNALQTVTGGRINRWLDAYEDFVGLTEVRLAQEYVTKVLRYNSGFVMLMLRLQNGFKFPIVS